MWAVCGAHLLYSPQLLSHSSFRLGHNLLCILWADSHHHIAADHSSLQPVDQPRPVRQACSGRSRGVACWQRPCGRSCAAGVPGAGEDAAGSGWWQTELVVAVWLEQALVCEIVEGQRKLAILQS